MGRSPLWQRMARIQAELRGPYLYDLPADEIERKFHAELAVIKRARVFKIEDEPHRKTSGQPFRVALNGGTAPWR
jgi:hypothetical protein